METETTFKKGDTFYNPNTGKPEGSVQFDAQTGKPLAEGATTVQRTPQLIVTGSRPAAQFAQNQQELNQRLNQTAYTPPPLPSQTGQNQQGGKIESPYAGMETYSDQYTQMLDKIASTSDLATKNLVATIKATKANRENSVNQEYDRLKQGLMSLGISTGNINFTPDLVYGSITQAENARMGKLQELDREEATALLEAQEAVDNKDFALLKDRMDYVRQLKKDKLDTIKDLAGVDRDMMQKAEFFGDYIYDSIKGLSGNQKQAVLERLSQQTGIPMMYLVGAASTISQDRTKASKTSGGSGTTATLASDKKEILNIFNSTVDGHKIKGDDGYLDPYVYVRAYEQWRHGNSAWLTAFDPKKFINPASYNILPEAIRPKKTGGINIEDL